MLTDIFRRYRKRLVAWNGLISNGDEGPTFQKSNGIEKVNPLTTNVPYHIETSQLICICIANELTGFYICGTLVVNRLKNKS